MHAQYGGNQILEKLMGFSKKSDIIRKENRILQEETQFRERKGSRKPQKMALIFRDEYQNYCIFAPLAP